MRRKASACNIAIRNNEIAGSDAFHRVLERRRCISGLSGCECCSGHLPAYKSGKREGEGAEKRALLHVRASTTDNRAVYPTKRAYDDLTKDSPLGVSLNSARLP